METFGLYLLKSAVWLTGFTLVFLTVLRNERYFQLNRIYLLSGIVASIAFPFYTWHYAVITPSLTGTISISGIAAQVIPYSEPEIPFYWWFYAAGLGWLAFRLIWQTVKVIRKLRKTGYEVSGPVKLVRTAEYAASFSFFSYVFVNPSTSDVETREIVNHEREHIEQRHWFDLLLVEVLCMLQWFNPFVWVYAHLIRQNHEYLADEKALQCTSDPAIYQATLLNQLLGAPVISLANSFSYSLNKKRFKMMKKSIHSPFRKLRLLLILPLMALVFYAFAKPEYVTAGTDRVSLVTANQDEKVGILKGKVVDPDGKPLAGAAVVIKGTTIGTISDKEGNFKLKDVPLDKEVVISYVGYQTVQTRADVENSMLIKMDRTSVGIDKVVVVGYGESGTAPVAINDKIDPNHPPLYVVDGVITEKRRAEYFMSVGVESVNVLKGKSATDKYGEKGINGVVELILKKDSPNSSLSEPAVSGSAIKFSDSKNPPLFIVDDSPVSESIFKAINPERIYSVNVLKGEAAIKKFGDKAKNGVVEVILKTNTKPLVYTDSLTRQRISVRTNEFNQYGNSKATPLFVLDGVIIDKAKMDAIKPDNIESISVLKDKSATALYGEKGKDGVILITSKKKGAVSAESQIKKMISAPGEGTKSSGVFTAVEQMPQFVGGYKELMKFLMNHIRYPHDAQVVNVQGQVLVNFVISRTGKVENAKVIKSIHPALDAEALRVVNLMPDWLPGKQQGAAVDVSYSIPIEFVLQRNEKKSDEVTVVGYGKMGKKEGEPFVVVEEMPQFPGGETEMMKFIGNNVKYPAQAVKENIQGKVLVKFVIKSDGKIDMIKVLRGVHPALDAEAMRVIGLMPDWIPGKQGGKPVDVSYTVPIQFKLQ